MYCTVLPLPCLFLSPSLVSDLGGLVPAIGGHAGGGGSGQGGSRQSGDGGTGANTGAGGGAGAGSVLLLLLLLAVGAALLLVAVGAALLLLLLVAVSHVPRPLFPQLISPLSDDLCARPSFHVAVM